MHRHSANHIGGATTFIIIMATLLIVAWPLALALLLIVIMLAGPAFMVGRWRVRSYGSIPKRKK